MGKRRIGQLERKKEMGRKQREWKREGVRDERKGAKKKKWGEEGMTEQQGAQVTESGGHQRPRGQVPGEGHTRVSTASSQREEVLALLCALWLGPGIRGYPLAPGYDQDHPLLAHMAWLRSCHGHGNSS